MPSPASISQTSAAKGSNPSSALQIGAKAGSKAPGKVPTGPGLSAARHGLSKWPPAARRAFWTAVVSAVIGGFFLLLNGLIPLIASGNHVPTGVVATSPTLTPTDTSTPAPTATPTPLTGKPSGSSPSFVVYPTYSPSGYVGDTGDIIGVAQESSLVRFTYEAKGRGPHQWDYTCLPDGTLNTAPCNFAGVSYLDGDWGKLPGYGFDLRGRHLITWKARSLNEPVYVEFVIGGVVWNWNEQTHQKDLAPYPDSMPHTSLGKPRLTNDWQTFSFDLSAHGITEDDLRHVVAAFGWVITLDSNPGQGQTFSIEIQDIAYE